jgi:hypothetical protein
VDPLKPFASIIRSLRTAESKRTASVQKKAGTEFAGTPNPLSAITHATPSERLRMELQARVGALKTWDTAQARTLFVESVLLTEIGDNLQSDSSFDVIVNSVCQQLGNDPTLSRRLDELLREISADHRADQPQP